MLGVMTLGKRIRAARERAGKTQHEVAVALGLESRESVSNWERDKNPPTLPNLIAFCDYVQASLDEVAGLREESWLHEWEALGRALNADQRDRLRQVGEAFRSYNAPKKPTG